MLPVLDLRQGLCYKPKDRQLPERAGLFRLIFSTERVVLVTRLPWSFPD